jgi:hypothetical protein
MHALPPRFGEIRSGFETSLQEALLNHRRSFAVEEVGPRRVRWLRRSVRAASGG